MISKVYANGGAGTQLTRIVRCWRRQRSFQPRGRPTATPSQAQDNAATGTFSTVEIFCVVPADCIDASSYMVPATRPLLGSGCRAAN